LRGREPTTGRERRLRGKRLEKVKGGKYKHRNEMGKVSGEEAGRGGDVGKAEQC